MSKEKAIIHYKTAVTVLRKWLAEGIISEDELKQIDMAIAHKYALTSCSIYR
ncbi:MAG: hypothetical protein KGZ50_09420 [Peptococcaceae bacterium]|nr:hypothetical protein [Peptococcaceae bacterium]